MTFDDTLLVPELREKIRALMDACMKEGVEMRPYAGLRTPFEQARLWRQSRTREEIERKTAELKRAGAPFLAHCIESVGPRSGRPATNAIPGFSWHQWGEAVDCVWIVDGASEWSTQKRVNGVNGYGVYAREARALGLDPGGLWRNLKDWPHVQSRQVSSPSKVLSLIEIDMGMKERFGE